MSLPFGAPSPLLMRWADELTGKRPMLEAGCGSGRNAIALSRLGHKVVCADRDLKQLRRLARFVSRKSIRNLLFPVYADLTPEGWPFGKNRFAAVICVHFLDEEILPLIQTSLCWGGHLFIETIGGQGENHRDLPGAGALQKLLSPRFSFKFYEERPVGPACFRKVAVKLLAQKIR